jgi:hypothetical protein
MSLSLRSRRLHRQRRRRFADQWAFANANIPYLKMEFVDQICAASGGPCTDTGEGPLCSDRPSMPSPQAGEKKR